MFTKGAMKTTALFILLLVPALSRADINKFSIDAFLIDNETQTAVEDPVVCTFSLYEVETGGEATWSTSETVDPTAGSFSVEIGGDDFPSPSELPDALYLGIQCGSDSEMTPRLAFSSAPYAMRALRSDTADLADVATIALGLANDSLGSGLVNSNGEIGLDTTVSQTWSGTQSHTAQTIFSSNPADTTSANATLRINPTIADTNDKLLVVQDNGTDRLVIDKEGDITIAGTITFSNLANCNTIDTNASGLLTCGTDASGGGLDAGSVTTTEILDNTITATDLSSGIVLTDGDLLNLSAINLSGTAEGLILPQADDVSAATAEGQISWDKDNDALYIGTGSTASLINPFGTTIDAADISTGAITSLTILDNTVASADIAADTIVAGDIATGGVATAEILDDTITATDLAGTLTFGSTDWIDLSAVGSGTGKGLYLPQANDVSGSTAAGQIAWDADQWILYVGTGTTPSQVAVNGFGQFIDSSEITDGTVTSSDIADTTIVGGDLATNIAITSTGAQDFGGATGGFEIPNDTGPTVNVTGEIAIDTTDDQLIFFGGSAKRVLAYEQTRCMMIEDLSSTDDNIPMGSFVDAVTVTGVWCTCSGTCTTKATFTLEDGSGNAMTITGTNPTCSAIGTVPDAAAVTAANGLTARESLRFDVTNTPTASDEYEICVAYTYDAQ